MKKTIKNIILFFMVLLSYPAIAQRPMSLYYMENVPQSVIVNPAMVPRANAFVGVPFVNMVYLNFYSDLLGPEVFQKGSNGEYKTLTHPEFDYSPLYNRIDKAANIRMNETVKDILFGFSSKKGYFVFGVSEKLTQTANLPVDLFKMVDQGFPKGTQYDFGGLAMNSKYYREYSVGYSYNFMNKLRIGANAKLLQGLVALKTDLRSVKLNTNIDEWAIDVDGDVYISAPIEVYTNENGVPDSILMPEDILGEAIKTGVLNFKNPGFAFDIGAVYKYDDYWTFSGALNDVGFIKWSNNLNSFNASGKYTFTGLSIDGSNMDSIGSAVDDLIDTVKTAIKLTHGSESFSTGIGPRLYLGAQYNLTHSISFGLLSRSVFLKNDFRQEINISANANLYHVLTASLNYTLSFKGYNTIGFGLGLRGGPFQFYVAGDYFPYAVQSIIINTTQDDGEVVTKELLGPDRLNNLNLVFGVNLLFGPNGHRDESMIDAYNEF